VALGRLKPGRQLFRYLAVSGVSAALSLSLPVVFHQILGLKEETAVAASLFTVFVTNFFTIRLYAFRSRGRMGAQLVKFALSSAVFRAGEFFLFLMGFRYAGLHYMAALVIALGLSFVAKYHFQKRYVFV